MENFWTDLWSKLILITLEEWKIILLSFSQTGLSFLLEALLEPMVTFGSILQVKINYKSIRIKIQFQLLLNQSLKIDVNAWPSFVMSLPAFNVISYRFSRTQFNLWSKSSTNSKLVKPSKRSIFCLCHLKSYVKKQKR